MHPTLKPALRRGWRDMSTMQFGVAPAHALVLGPMDTATGSFLTLLDGTRGLPLLREEARRMGLPDGHVDKLLTELSRAGLLDDATGGGPAADALRKRSGTMDRLRSDLASLSLLSSEPGEAVERLAARRAMHVRVQGAGRVGAVVASVLAGAGVGRVEVLDGGHVEPWDVAPGGLPAEAIGERRDTTARRLVRQSAPDRPPRAHRPASPGSQAAPLAAWQASAAEGQAGLSLVIIAPRDGLDAYAPDPLHTEGLLSAGTPHLYAGVVEGTGVVGPLVLPGATACAGCLFRQRADRDPTWGRMLAQWRSGRARPVPACDLALSTSVAGLVAGHALAFLDGTSMAASGVRWEASVPGFDWHARPVWPHPACPCGAGADAKKDVKGDRLTAAGERHATMAG
ncbi:MULTISPECIES: TOMM precursor leader peptide-binding protein [Streptomyces]|uniref:TOMM precursor leader peptide-binding protein n=1 Tax=Streptomyces TaxID=1883 RepID=UPI001E579356|nr:MULTISPECIES: TOMM precursor leader peptide-binding protein [Streptomyces]UFQ17923.1 TOMM precursor leader peptide-binding protein [Streptomyces huasconensis]WCL87531.1 TOMM precursor leader peptide-binding protein [Streptomyces sp. JCM 35825]